MTCYTLQTISVNIVYFLMNKGLVVVLMVVNNQAFNNKRNCNIVRSIPSISTNQKKEKTISH